MNKFDRLKLILKNKNFNKIKKSNLIIFGIGGVGGYVVEALVRSGIEKITLVDNDIIDITNFNRNINAIDLNIGKNKVDVMADRIYNINPNVLINCEKKIYFEKENNYFFDRKNNCFDYVIDTMDTIKSKIDLANFCYKNKIKIISSMGAGNKFDPTKFIITDLFKTYNDPIAKIMRKELKKINVKKLKVIFSTEKTFKINIKTKKRTKSEIASTVFVPGVAGFMIAYYVIKNLIEYDN